MFRKNPERVLFQHMRFPECYGGMKEHMKNFLKGIVVGLGGVAPGLSGSVLLIIFGLYQKVLDALGTLLVNFKNNVRFLLPIVSGMFVGVLLFSKVLDFFLTNFEMPTRFCFLGLILGTVPLLFAEVKKNGFGKMYYLVVVLSAVFGTWMFTMNPGAFPQVTDPTLWQSVILGVAVAATAIIPGVDPAVLLSSLGFYEMYLRALATFDLNILIPMVGGLAIGAVAISFGMSLLFKHFYTATFSVIFGVFLSMIPNMLNESCVLGLDARSVVSIVMLVVGFAVSYFLGDIEENRRRLKQWMRKLG